MNMKFFMPTKMVMGRDCIRENAALLAGLGKKAMIVTGKRSAKINGSGQDVEEALKSQNLAFCLFDRIEANPSIQSVREAAKIAREEKVDFIIGIGGGSPLDAAKAIAILTANDLDDTALFSGNYPNGVLPVAAVPTTAGTGSEVTQYSILTDDNIQSKNSIASETIFPKLAFLDARYTEKLPINVTINTGIDALSHSVEGYISRKATALSSSLAAEGIRILGKVLMELAGSVDFDAREKLLYASMIGGIVIAHTGTTALHSMGYSLTYFKDIEHGRANGLLMAEYLKYISSEYGEKISEIVGLMGVGSLEELKKLLDRLLGSKESIADSEIKLYSSMAIKAKNIGNTLMKPTEGDLAAIIEKSFK